MSGGEQQMQAIGPSPDGTPPRAALDEPTESLAPVYVRLLFDLIAGLRRQGLTILIVEQNVHNVLRTADRAYVLKNGRIVMQGERPTLYLGL
jgi:branched-chain amino acid transport system ATP-binding protein